MDQEALQNLVNSFYPADFKAHIVEKFPSYARYVELAGYENYFIPPVVTVKTVGEGYGVVLKVIQPLLGISITLYVKPVEACCGMAFIHHFRVDLDNGSKKGSGLTQDQFDQIMTGFLAWCVKNVSGAVKQRIMVNMIESNGNHKDPLEDLSQRSIVEKMINYKPLWDYFHKVAAKVNVQQMPNANTGNVILHMEVLFNSAK